MAPSPAAGHRTATLVSPLKSGLLDRARADYSLASAPGLHGWWLRGCGSSAIALASFLLLPMAAAAAAVARPMDCRKPRVARFPGRTRPSLRTDNRQPIGAVVTHSGVLLSPGQRVAVLGYDR